MAKSKIDCIFDDIFSSGEKSDIENGVETDYRHSPSFAIFDEPLETDEVEESVSITRFPSENFLHLDYPIIDISK